MIRVEEAEKIILSRTRDYGLESVPFESAMGRVLATDLLADRDLPPCNRATMDGIAISYDAFENGIRQFFIKGIQAAGDKEITTSSPEACVEIMTGGAIPSTADTVIRYEDIHIENGMATLLPVAVKKGQNIHVRGKDKKQGEVVVPSGRVISPAVISMVASIGAIRLDVKKMPRTVIISTGDELIDPGAIPSPEQIRRSNSYTIKAVLQQYALPADLLHIPDDAKATSDQLHYCLQHYDVILVSGGVSKGRFDYVPKALEDLEVKQLFHQVQQRPGKPFWFGEHGNGALVFAFPGNPVSTFMCLHRYFLPWLKASSGIKEKQALYAILDEDFSFKPALQYFLQVTLHFSDKGALLATPAAGNGSGDFANLTDTDAFMELPMEGDNFKKGAVYPIWPFKQLFA